jgi:hypothetical protein
LELKAIEPCNKVTHHCDDLLYCVLSLTALQSKSQQRAVFGLQEFRSMGVFDISLNQTPQERYVGGFRIEASQQLFVA